MVRADELQTEDDRILLNAQRAAQRDDWALALAGADEVLKNDPTRAEAMFLAGAAMRKAGNEGVAALIFNLATKLEPKRAAIWLQLAMCLHERHPAEAYRAAMKAQELSPDLGDTLSVLCNVASTLGRHAEAIDWAERSEKLYGYIGEVSHNKSFALMALGRWKEGWRAFKPSLGMPARKIRNYHSSQETPRWDPTKHDKAVVVLYGEQGIGDEIMYASMIDKAIEAAAARGSRIVIECDKRNASLFRRSFNAPVYGTRSEMYCDWPADEKVTHKLEFGGLGEFFASEPFRRGAYLKGDIARHEEARAWLEVGDVRKWLHQDKKALRVGLAWTGGSWETGRARRSLAFEEMIAVTRGQEAQFVSLEYEDREADLELAPHIFNPHWMTRKGADMDGLAGLILNLDLVIAVQTSVVDLCGALGVQCWALTDSHPQWRYIGVDGDDTMAFYESVKVYRQTDPGVWGPVIQRVSRDLAAMIEEAKASA